MRGGEEKTKSFEIINEGHLFQEPITRTHTCMHIKARCSIEQQERILFFVFVEYWQREREKDKKQFVFAIAKYFVFTFAFALNRKALLR